MGNILIDDAKFVKEQYKNSRGLRTRISIHDKYSTNKMGLHNWYFTVMKFEDGMKVLELGTGSAVMWVNHKDIIGRLSQLVLSDMSEGMLAEAKKNLEVTNIDDLMDYIYSGITFENSCTLSKDEVRERLTAHMVGGVLKLPKDPGLFVAW